MDELTSLLLKYYKSVAPYPLVENIKEVHALIAKIEEVLTEKVTIKRVLTYTGNKVDIEKGLSIRSVQGSRNSVTYTIIEEFIDV